jgi:hypothetical protein
MKLGKLPAREDAVKLKMTSFVDMEKWGRELKIPKEFGHDDKIVNWQMFANDVYGDCVWAGAAHEHMMWCAAVGKRTNFTQNAVLGAYAAVTGFDEADPSSDNGTDMSAAAKYRRDVGLMDTDGTVHKIGAYLAIKPGDVLAHLIALRLFGAVGVGIVFPDTAWDQTKKNQPWSYVRKYKEDGGHYIPLTSRRGGRNVCVTWGKRQPMTDSFFKHFNDESIAYVPLDMLDGTGRTPEGFDVSALTDALNKLR